MLKVRFQFDSARARLGALQDALFPAEAVLQPAVAVVARAIERNFEEEGRPARWKPLTSAYARWKEQRYPGRKILTRTGNLRRSITTRVEGDGVGRAAIIASTDVPYAAAHQFGAPINHLPPRPFLVLTREDEEEAARAIATALSKVTLGSGPEPVPPTAGAPPENSQ